MRKSKIKSLILHLKQMKTAEIIDRNIYSTNNLNIEISFLYIKTHTSVCVQVIMFYFESKASFLDRR